MKIRNSFVSNSSSSSFIIGKSHITPEFICLLNNQEVLELKAETFGLSYINCLKGWNISFTEDYVAFNTSMDNFNMKELLIKLGMPKEAIKGVW